MKKLFLYSCIFIFLFLTSGCAVKSDLSTIQINGHVFNVEIADSDAEHYQGLSGREDLAENTGMLFVFDDYKVRNFVMRDMNFPLDIVWIKDDKVIECEKDTPILEVITQVITQVISPEAINYVLEINTGLCEEYNIKKGDGVDIKINIE